MALIIVLNALVCLCVIVMVVSPLLWAIFTQHRDHVAVAGTAARATADATRPTPPRHQLARARRAAIPAGEAG